MRFALSLSPTIGPPSSLSPLAHPTSVPCRRKFTHLIRVPHQNRTAPLSPSLTPAALEASVVTILSTSVASLLPLFFSLHLQRNDGDPNSLAELLSASAEEMAILNSIDVPPSRPPAPSQVHRQPALLLFRQSKGVSRIRSVISPTQQRAFGEDDLFKNRFDCGIQTRIEARFPPVRLPLAKKIPPSLLAPPK